MIEKWKQWARQLKVQVYALYLAYRDPRVPWYARILAACVVAYAFSPIDLIPDPIPIIGYLDDLVIVPIGTWLVLKMIPATVMDECRLRAEEVMRAGKPVNWIAAVVIVAIWFVVAGILVLWFWRMWNGV